MILRPRLMSEAPKTGEKVYCFAEGGYMLSVERANLLDQDTTFYLLSDLLAAAALLHKMTPKGYEFTGEWRQAETFERYYQSGIAVTVMNTALTKGPVPILRELPEPVKYKFEAEAERRCPYLDDWVWEGLEWVEMTNANLNAYRSDHWLCARRVEVKP
jgi:hypothetical protein